MKEQTRNRCILLFGIALVASCTHAGVGEGRVMAPVDGPDSKQAEDGQAKFVWRSGYDASVGEIECMLPNGRLYTGEFVQLRAKIDTYETGATLAGWSGPAWARDPWYGGPPAQVEGVNTGKVVALLKHEDGARMRCKFLLKRPDSGMTRGASGQCLLSDQTLILGAELPKSSPR